MDVVMHTRKTLRVLVVIVVCLVVASSFAHYYRYFIGHDRYLVRLFSADHEWNVPTYYSAVTLLFCSVLLAIIGGASKEKKDKFHLHWKFLSLIFLLMSIDESLQLHEQTIGLLRRWLGLGGLLYYSWVILGIIFVAILGVFYLKLLLNIERRMRILLLLSGLLYLAGAVGMEMISGKYAATHGVDNYVYAVLTDVEESLEFVGIVMLIYTLQTYISSNLPGLRIRIAK